MTIYQRIASNTAISAIGRIVSSVLALVSIGFITRALGQDGFGGYATILAYLSLFVILADLGLQSLMTREISRREGGVDPVRGRPAEGTATAALGRPASNGVEKIASNFFTIRLVSSLIFLLAGFFASFLFPYSRVVQLGIGVGVIGFFSLSMSQVLLSVFQKHLAMQMSAISEVVGRGAQLIFVFLIFKLDGGLLLFILAMSGASVVIFLLNFLFAQRYIKVRLNFDFSYWRNILKTTWPIALSIVLTLIYFKIDTIFLSLMKPEADVGIYGVAYKVLESLIFFPAMFAGIMLPILSRDAVSDLAHFRQVFQRSFRVIAIFAFPAVAGGWVLAYSIANLIGGKEFLVSGAPMQALFVACGIIFFGNILGRAIIALDLQKKAVLAYLFGVVFNVVLNLIFIPKYTYMGAAWTTVLTEFIIVIFLLWLVWRKTGVSFGVIKITKAAFAAALMGGTLFFFLALRSLGEGGVSPVTAPLSFLGLGLATISGAGIYFAALYLMRGISKEEVLAILRR